MAACTKCGATLAPAAVFCGSCGAPVVVTAGSSTPGAGPVATYNSPSAAGSANSMASNVVALLCYVVCPITSIIFLVLEPYNKDKFVRFHAFQSLFLGIACIVISILLSIVKVVIGMVPVIGWLIDMLLWMAVWLGLLAAWIYAMVKAYNNEKYKLPLIGNIAAQQAG